LGSDTCMKPCAWAREAARDSRQAVRMRFMGRPPVSVEDAYGCEAWRFGKSLAVQFIISNL
jgi:hypothetical protein